MKTVIWRKKKKKKEACEQEGWNQKQHKAKMWLGVKRNDCPEPTQTEAEEERAQDKGYSGN